MVCHHPAKFGDQRHCDGGEMFLVTEKEDSRCSGFNPPLLFIYIKDMARKHTKYVNNFDTSHTHLTHQLE